MNQLRGVNPQPSDAENPDKPLPKSPGHRGLFNRHLPSRMCEKSIAMIRGRFSLAFRGMRTIDDAPLVRRQTKSMLQHVEDDETPVFRAIAVRHSPHVIRFQLWADGPREICLSLCRAMKISPKTHLLCMWMQRQEKTADSRRTQLRPLMLSALRERPTTGSSAPGTTSSCLRTTQDQRRAGNKGGNTDRLVVHHRF